MGTDTGPPLARRIGPRLRALRLARDQSQADVARATGLAASVLSRLENGERVPSLEHLLALAAHHDVPIDTLVGDERRGDPRVHLRPLEREGMTLLPLARRPGGIQAYKVLFPPASAWGEPRPRVHEGFQWCCVLDGRLRLVLEGREHELGPGEGVEFDTSRQHWLGSADEQVTEVLMMFSATGLRVDVGPTP